jgi:hypothetical protein
MIFGKESGAGEVTLPGAFQKKWGYGMDTLFEIVNTIWPFVGPALLIGALVALGHQIKNIFS